MFYTVINIWDSLDYSSKEIIQDTELKDVKERDNLININ